MKCYMMNPNTGQPCGSEEHLAKDCPFNPQNRSSPTETSTNLATDMRTPMQATASWGPEYVTSASEPMYMIVVEWSDSSDDDDASQSEDPDYPRSIVYGRRSRKWVLTPKLMAMMQIPTTGHKHRRTLLLNCHQSGTFLWMSQNRMIGSLFQ